MTADVDVLIPARSGSVGLPGKNMRVLVDRPLVLHSIACAQLLGGVRHIFVSTDDPVLAQEARRAGAHVPTLRPDELATSATPMVDVIRHAMTVLHEDHSATTDFLLLLDPTSPLRNPSAIDYSVDLLRAADLVDGAVSVSIPSFNPLWVGVEVGKESLLRRHPLTPNVFSRRQDVPGYWRINGSFYVWRNAFARRIQEDWLDQGTFIGVETPEILSHSIDTPDDFRLVEALITGGVVSVPWMGEGLER